ncbi:MAG: DNA translocase FtsK 4TM domain-containing protein, partial [bacterium]
MAARHGRHHFLSVFLTGSAALLLVLSLIPTGEKPNLLGRVGSDVSFILYGAFGLLAWIFPLLFLGIAFAIYREEPFTKPGLKILGLILGLASACSILHILTPNVSMFSPAQMRDGVEWGGQLGFILGEKLRSVLTSFGTVMVCLLALVLAAWFLEVEDWLLEAAKAGLKSMGKRAEWARTHGFQALFKFYERLSKTIERWNARLSEKKAARAARAKLKTERQAYSSVFSGAAEKKESAPSSTAKEERKPESQRGFRPSTPPSFVEPEDMVSAAMAEAQGPEGMTRRQQMEAADIDPGEDAPASEEPMKPKRMVRAWKLPSIQLLRMAEDSKDKPFDNFEPISRTIIETLSNFNVEAKVVGVNPG